MAEKSVEQYLDEQRAEWGAYVATSVIHIHGARAFNVGDPVPASHVTSGVVDKSQVAPAKPAASKES
jgi:hypothetical protein